VAATIASIRPQVKHPIGLGNHFAELGHQFDALGLAATPGF
jgi:hypothetical protein